MSNKRKEYNEFKGYQAEMDQIYMERQQMAKKLEKQEKMMHVVSLLIIALAIYHAISGMFYGANVSALDLGVWMLIAVANTSKRIYVSVPCYLLAMVLSITSIFI